MKIYILLIILVGLFILLAIAIKQHSTTIKPNTMYTKPIGPTQEYPYRLESGLIDYKVTEPVGHKELVMSG